MPSDTVEEPRKRSRNPKSKRRLADGGDYTQFNVSIPKASKKWLDGYCDRHGVTLSVAVTHMIFLLYEVENGKSEVDEC
jgi:hypothetical protein